MSGLTMRTKVRLAGLLLLTCLPSSGQQVQSKTDVLTPAQRTKMIAIQKDAEQKAAPAAAHLAEITRQIYANMLAETPDEALRTKLSGEMRDAVWQLFEIKGQSIHDAIRVLTPTQRKQLKTEMVKPGAPADITELIGKIFLSTEADGGK